MSVSKRAQVQQIMIFVIGLVIISLVLLFGYTVIQDLNEDRCEVRKTQFSTQLLQEIDRNKGWGTEQIVEILAPCEAARVCFVDRDIIDNYYSDMDEDALFGSIDEGLTTAQLGVIRASTRSGDGGDLNPDNYMPGDQTNVFIITETGIVQPVDRFSSSSAALQIVYDTTPDPTIECVDIEDETLRARFKGTGKRVQVVGNVQG